MVVNRSKLGIFFDCRYGYYRYMLARPVTPLVSGGRLHGYCYDKNRVNVGPWRSFTLLQTLSS
jgi:hypothetical protein